MLDHLAAAPSPGSLSNGNDLSLCSRKGLFEALVPTAALERRPQSITDFSRNLGDPGRCSMGDCTRVVDTASF